MNCHILFKSINPLKMTRLNTKEISAIDSYRLKYLRQCYDRCPWTNVCSYQIQKGNDLESKI